MSIMPSADFPAFTVIYRWRLAPGREDQFLCAWERITIALRNERSSLGSRLHQADDGTWLAYAQWPDRETWQRSQDAGPVDAQAALLMREAIAESFDPVLLRPIADHLARADE